MFRDASRQRGFGAVEVGEETLAALLEACRRSGDVDSLEEAVSLLCEYGVRPPQALMTYLSGNTRKGPESAMYKLHFGQGTESEQAWRRIRGTNSDANLKRIKSNMDDVWDSLANDDWRGWGDGGSETENGEGDTGEAKKAADSPAREPARVWRFDGKVQSMRTLPLSQQ